MAVVISVLVRMLCYVLSADTGVSL